MRRFKLTLSFVLLCWASVASAVPSFLFQRITGRVGQFAQTPDGRILAAGQDAGQVIIYTEAGTEVGRFGAYQEPTGVAVDLAGNIYVSDQAAGQIHKYTQFLVPVTSWGSPGSAPGQLNRPTNLAVSPDGTRLYVTELLNARVSVFGTDGSFVTSFGILGSAPGQLNFPFGIVVEPVTGNLVIANELNDRVDFWSPSGLYLASFGSNGTAPGQFRFPVGVGRDPMNGDLYVTDQLNNRIQKFTPSGSPILQWGSFGGAAGQMYNPWSVFVSFSGNIWVGDTYNYRIQVFAPEGGNPVPTRTVTWGSVKSR